MNIIDKLLTHNRPYTRRFKTTAVAVHWVGNAGSTADANRNYFQNTNIEVSSNFIVGLKGEIICCIPDNEISWCTNQANSYTVSIETCHPDLTGKFNDSTYNSLVELSAFLCEKYKLNPLNGGLIRHFDVTGKICPKWFVKAVNGGSDDNNNTQWNNFKLAVHNKIIQNDFVVNNNNFMPYTIKVNSPDGFLNIRDAPTFVMSKVVGKIKNSNVKYTIVEEKNINSVKFGKLKSGAGWISLNDKYVTRV